MCSWLIIIRHLALTVNFIILCVYSHARDARIKPNQDQSESRRGMERAEREREKEIGRESERKIQRVSEQQCASI